jgi:hypothetical protein
LTIAIGPRPHFAPSGVSTLAQAGIAVWVYAAIARSSSDPCFAIG